MEIKQEPSELSDFKQEDILERFKTTTEPGTDDSYLVIKTEPQDDSDLNSEVSGIEDNKSWPVKLEALDPQVAQQGMDGGLILRVNQEDQNDSKANGKFFHCLYHFNEALSCSSYFSCSS